MQKIKLKHNKKRNTAFLFECLTKELTKAVVEKNDDRKTIILSILKEHFSKGKVLAFELDVYKSLYETRGLNKPIAERMLNEAKRMYFSLHPQDIFNQQSRVINDVNKKLGPTVFSNFMSNYKDLATIAQIFDQDMPIKSRVILEEHVVGLMSSTEENKSTFRPVDNILYKQFVKKFNEKYGSSLIEEQKMLLTKYITSFSDDEMDFKFFLNEELTRIKNIISKSETLNESQDKQEILKLIESFKNTQINSSMIESVLKLQTLVKEIS